MLVRCKRKYICNHIHVYNCNYLKLILTGFAIPFQAIISEMSTTLVIDDIERGLYESYSLKEEMIFPLKDHPTSTTENIIREHGEVYVYFCFDWLIPIRAFNFNVFLLVYVQNGLLLVKCLRVRKDNDSYF